MADTIWSGRLVLKDGTEVSVAPFGKSDLDAIYDIECRAHPGPWNRSHFVDSLQTPHHQCLGVRLYDQWLGYAIVSCVAGEAELLLLVVDKPWQGRGVASSLLNFMFQALLGRADTLFLEVRASNGRAIELYERMEFNELGIRPNYYRSATGVEDALIFARTLA